MIRRIVEGLRDAGRRALGRLLDVGPAGRTTSVRLRLENGLMIEIPRAELVDAMFETSRPNGETWIFARFKARTEPQDEFVLTCVDEHGVEHEPPPETDEETLERAEALEGEAQFLRESVRGA